MAEEVEFDEKEFLADLERESKEFDKDAEIDRILKAFRLDAYAVLGLLPGVADGDIKITYRKKSLLIHPDKSKNPQAPEAFDRLKKAQTSLLDEKERAALDEAIADARMLLMRDNKWTVDSPELREDDFIKRLWPEKTKHVLIDNEMRRRKQMKAQMQEEGRQQRKDDEELEAKKRKREHDTQWEASRDGRINSWRDFQKGGKPNGLKTGAKKKKKLDVLG